MSNVLDMSWKCKDCTYCFGIEGVHGLCLVDERTKYIYRERNPTINDGYYGGHGYGCGGCPEKLQFFPADGNTLGENKEAMGYSGA